MVDIKHRNDRIRELERENDRLRRQVVRLQDAIDEYRLVVVGEWPHDMAWQGIMAEAEGELTSTDLDPPEDS